MDETKMNIDEITFFDKMPDALPLYEAVRNLICSEFERVAIKVQKTQITFSNKYGFAFVSLPYRRVKGRPDVYIIFTLGLSYRLEHPRIMEATEPYPGRWTHHIIIQNVDEVDSEIKEWVAEAYSFAMIK